MKVLIWLGCILAMSFVVVMLRYGGIILGGLPTALLFAAMCFGAKSLCRVYDSKRHKKNQNHSEEDS